MQKKTAGKSPVIGAARRLPFHVCVMGRQRMSWFLYIIHCTDDSLYTGITTDVERRLRQHANGSGAKYFRGRAPQKLVYVEGGHTRSSAARREVEVKRMSREKKIALIVMVKTEG